MAKDRSLRFQSPAEVAEALVAFCGSRAAQYSAVQVGVLKEAAAETGRVQASLLKTLGDRALPHPPAETGPIPPGAEVKIVVLVAVLLAASIAFATVYRVAVTVSGDGILLAEAESCFR